MSLPACIITLLVVYPCFLAAGYWFYRTMQKRKPTPFPAGDVRNKMIRPWRIAVHVVLLPLAATLSLAVLGGLDPLFFAIRSLY